MIITILVSRENIAGSPPWLVSIVKTRGNESSNLQLKIFPTRKEALEKGAKMADFLECELVDTTRARKKSAAN